MDLDKRQQEIQEGKGLTESRLNTDFIDFLKKWSSPILLIIAVVAMGFLAYRKYNEYRAGKLDAAWIELNSALVSDNAASLVAVADDHAGMAGIPLVARLRAGDIYRLAAVTGVLKLNDEGKPATPDDVLNADQRNSMLDKADEQFKKVVEIAGTDPAQALHSVPALFRLAAVAEQREQWDAAKGYYERAASIADSARFATLAAAAKTSIDTMNDFKAPATLLPEAQVVTKPIAIVPPTPGISSPLLPGSTPLVPMPIAPPSLTPSSSFPGTGFPMPSIIPPPAQPVTPPTDPKPEEVKPGEPKPAEPAPAETPKPAEPKPAETPKPAEPPK